MDEPISRAKGLHQRMQETRSQLDQDMQLLMDAARGLAREARGLVDWRRNVKRYPWLAVGAAAALGYFLVPKRNKVAQLDANTLADLAKHKHLVLRVEGEPHSGMAGGLMSTVLAVAAREAATWVRKELTGLLKDANRSGRSPTG
jgi:hypothetical protein